MASMEFWNRGFVDQGGGGKDIGKWSRRSGGGGELLGMGGVGKKWVECMTAIGGGIVHLGLPKILESSLPFWTCQGLCSSYNTCEMGTRRSSGKLETIIVENAKDEMGKWITLRVSIGSWVTLQPSRNRIWEKKRRLDVLKSHWKGVVRAFKRSQQREKVEKVLIAHVYERKDLLKESVAKQETFPQIGLNCLCISDFEEWQPVESITSILRVFHSQIGEILYEGNNSMSLREEGVWFYKYDYFLPSSKRVGRIEEAKLPTLREIGLPSCNPTLIDCIRSKLVLEIPSGMREKGGACDHFGMHLPFLVFAEVFKEEDSIRMTKKTYSCTNPSDMLLSNLFYSGWNTRLHIVNGKQLKCVLSVETLRFRYSKLRQTLYVSF